MQCKEKYLVTRKSNQLLFFVLQGSTVVKTNIFYPLCHPSCQAKRYQRLLKTGSTKPIVSKQLTANKNKEKIMVSLAEY